MNLNDLLCILLLSLIVNTSTTAQKQDYVWLFGQDLGSSGVTGYMFDFNSPPMEVTEHHNNLSIASANASISDEDGNLLFFMNGCAVVDRNFEPMPNGDSLGYDIWWEIFTWPCDRGRSGNQDNIILNDPGNNDLYYIIHKPKIYNGPNTSDSIPIWYSVVDMSLNQGNGAVIAKNQVLDNSRIFLSSYLTAIKHDNMTDWWLLQSPTNDSLIHVYSLTAKGFSLHSIQESHHFMSRNRTSASGTAKFSPDGSKYAWYNYYDQLNLYDFNRATGQLTNYKNIQIIPEPDNDILLSSSVEWSPNSRFIYAASTNVLHQVDLWENDIQQNGIRLVDTYNGTLDPFRTSFFMMAQAPDCKIYMCPTSGTRSYHVINKPDELGSACNFVQNQLKLPQVSNFGGMPNFPRFRVDEEQKCDPTITSVFGDAVYYHKELETYPNPSNGRFTVKVPSNFSSGSIVVSDMGGQIVHHRSLTPNSVNPLIDITSYPSDIYTIELYSDDRGERVFWRTQVVKL